MDDLEDLSSGTEVDQVATTSSASISEAFVEDPVDWHKILRASVEADKRKWAQLPPIVKNVYTEDPEVSSMSTSQAAEWRRENFDIQVWSIYKDKSRLKLVRIDPESKPIPKPALTFEQAFKNYPEIMEKIKNYGFEKPLPIQSQAWPILLGGEDLIVTAPNGTGKTLAYLLPALIHIKGQIRPKEEKRVPLVLILVPARELAIQIHRLICYFKDQDIRSLCLYGENISDEQVEAIDKGVDIVVANPGCLKKFVDLEHLDAINFTYIVYDEADKLFDTKITKKVRLALFNVRPDHQRVFLSATWQPGVRAYINLFINDLTEITVGSVDLAATHTVTQEIIFLESDGKIKELLRFISKMSPTDKIIVFCNTTYTVSHVASVLAVRGIHYSTLHSKLNQEERATAFDAILQGSTKILVATDIASRGIDINDLTCVINYSMPSTPEDYIHRIGRTGRAGKSGRAISYMTKRDFKLANSLIKILDQANQEVPDELKMYAKQHTLMKYLDTDDDSY